MRTWSPTETEQDISAIQFLYTANSVSECNCLTPIEPASSFNILADNLWLLLGVITVSFVLCVGGQLITNHQADKLRVNTQEEKKEKAPATG